MTQGVRRWGNSADGPDEMLVGNYGEVGEAGQRLLAALPPTVVLRASEWRSPLVPLLLEEMAHEGVGQASLLDRLLDALVVSAVRHWAVTRGDAAPAWLAAATDPVVAEVLTLMHDRPGEPWSLVSLARETGVSRAALARRFRERVGESPMAYLTSWRMALAADRLRGEHRHRRPHRVVGGLPEPVLVQHGLQAGLRRQSVGLSGRSIASAA